MKPPLNVVVGRRFPRGAQKQFVLDRHYTQFSLHDPKANVSFDFEKLEQFVGHELHSLIRDLLDIAAIVYMSDRYRKRDQNWCRNISIRMPVRNIGIWNAVKADLVNLVSFLTGDDFDMHFVKSSEKSMKFEATKKVKDKRCICLFSGGLDSLSGAVWALQNHFKPVLASHYSIGRLRSVQSNLATGLATIHKRKIPFWPVYLTRSSKRKNIRERLGKPVENTQWSRSFLFLSIGTAYALDQNVRTVFMFENGILSINVPVSEARMNTRTAHPKFVSMYKNLIDKVFGVKLEVLNPFAEKTKTEVAKLLDNKRLRPLVRESVSCWDYPRGIRLLAKRRGIPGFQGRHCGICFPCIVRRISLHGAGLIQHDDSPVVDVFKEYPNLERSTITAMTDILRFCDQIDGLNPRQILVEYPHFFIDVEGVEPLRLVELYKRFAKETKQCFKELGNSKLISDFQSLLT